MRSIPRNSWPSIAVAIATLVASSISLAQHGHQTFAPHERNYADAPPAIVWSTPELPSGPIYFESAEERKLRVELVANHLEQPWSVAFLPDGALLITERAGRLRVVRNGRLNPRPVTGVPEVQTGGPRGLQGLMDVVLHPQFAQNHLLYLTYHKPTSDGAGAATVMRATWDGSALVDGRDIFESGAIDTEASRLAFDRHGMMYVSISAPGSPQVRRSQDPNDYAGKIVRLRDDGTIPPDNPFVKRAGYKPGIYTMGHRNGHGLALNPETGEMWQTEQGPSGGDEVNVLRPGRNYGWPIVSFGRDYWGSKISRRPFRTGMEDPSIVWLPSIGLTGMTFYTGNRFPHWQRNLFVGGLREGGVPRTGQIQRIVFNDSWQELRREPMLMELGQRIRDVREGPDGLLYVLTAEDDGALLKIEPR